MERHGDAKRSIEILKISCEGCELGLIKSWLKSGVAIRQIVVEIHWPDPSKNNNTSWELVHSLFTALDDAGYVVFHKMAMTGQRCRAQCFEYSFLRLAPAFG